MTQAVPDQNVPALQKQLDDPADEKAFAGHDVQAKAPVAEVWPAEQVEHDEAPLALAKNPGAQLVHAAAPESEEKLPGEQFVHEDAPGLDANLPGTQERQMVELTTGAYVPGLQLMHAGDPGVGA